MVKKIELDLDERLDPLQVAVKLHKLYDQLPKKDGNNRMALYVTGLALAATAQARIATFDDEDPDDYIKWLKIVHGQMELLGVPCPETDWDAFREMKE